MSKQRSVLGKGLSALIPGVALAEAQSRDQVLGKPGVQKSVERQADEKPPTGPTMTEGVSTIDLMKVAPNPQQPRKDFTPEALESLAQSIREHGVIQAITVRKVEGGRYELISGERRVRASIEAGLSQIPAHVIEVESDRKMLELAIIENVQREQLNPIEEAEGYEELIVSCGLTQEQVAERIGKDRSSITNFLRLLKLPTEIRDSLRKGDLGIGHAKAVLAVSEITDQITLWKRAVDEQLSVRRLEALARSKGRKAQPSRKSAGTKNTAETDSEVVNDGSFISFEDSLKQKLGTQVRVRRRTDSVGEIAIEFYSNVDLERIADILLELRHHDS